MKFEDLKNLLTEQLCCEAEKVTMDARMVEDLGADSLAMVELVMAVEEASGIKVPDEDAASLKTVRDVLEYVNARA